MALSQKLIPYGYAIYVSDYAVHADYRLPQPVLLSPPDGTLFRWEREEITLRWNAVTGATFYVVQICGNNNFRGPSLRGWKVEGETKYTLFVENNWTFGGKKFFWRVIAYTEYGGPSMISKIWSFKPGATDKDLGQGDGGAGGMTTSGDVGDGKGKRVMRDRGVDILQMRGYPNFEMMRPGQVGVIFVRINTGQSWYIRSEYPYNIADENKTLSDVSWSVEDGPIQIKKRENTRCVIRVDDDAEAGDYFGVKVTVTDNTGDTFSRIIQGRVRGCEEKDGEWYKSRLVPNITPSWEYRMKGAIYETYEYDPECGYNYVRYPLIPYFYPGSTGYTGYVTCDQITNAYFDSTACEIVIQTVDYQMYFQDGALKNVSKS